MQDLCEGHHTNHNPSQNKATTYLQGAAAGLERNPFRKSFHYKNKQTKIVEKGWHGQMLRVVWF